jgi:hypothetical protein
VLVKIKNKEITGLLTWSEAEDIFKDYIVAS